MAAGKTLRPNNSLAPSLGSFGLASGGNGFGSTLPLSWADTAELPAANKKARNIGIKNRPRFMAALYLTYRRQGIHQSEKRPRGRPPRCVAGSPRAHSASPNERQRRRRRNGAAPFRRPCPQRSTECRDCRRKRDSDKVHAKF